MFSAAFFLIIQLFGAVSGFIFSKITESSGAVSLENIDSANLEGYSSQMYGFLFLFISNIIIFAAALAYTYSFFENKIWNTIFGKKTDFKNTSRFLGLNIVMSVIFSIVLFVLFSLIAKFLYGIPKLGSIIFFSVLLFSVYLFFVGYWSFGKTHEVFRSLKNIYLVGIKRIDLTIFEMIFALVVAVLLNLILLLFSWLPETVYLVLTVIGLQVYFSWFRLYLTNALKSVKL